MMKKSTRVKATRPPPSYAATKLTPASPMTIYHFAPPIVDAAFAKRCARLFTRQGRAANALWRAQRAGGTGEARARLGLSIAALAANVTPPVRGILRDSLCFRIAAALGEGATPEAAEVLATLATVLPGERLRVAIRRALVIKLQELARHTELAEAVAALLADDLAVGAVPEVEVLAPLAVIHEALGLEVLGRVLATAKPRWFELPALATVRHLAQVPPSFTSRQEAAAAAAGVDGPCDGFPKTFQVAIGCLLTRHREWELDFAGMEQKAAAAHALAPASLAARYWLCRARMYQVKAAVAPLLEGGVPREVPAWQRLARLAALHHDLQSPLHDLESARGVLAVVNQELGPTEPPEQSQAMWLLEWALAGRFARGDAQLAECARLSALVPRSPAWAQVNLALKEIRLDRRYEAAVERLQAPSLAAYAPARPLALAARFLAGSLRWPVERAEECPAIVQLAAAWCAVAGPLPPGTAVDWQRLGAGVSGVLDDPILREIPAARAAANVLLLAVRFFQGDPAVRPQLPAFSVPPGAPRWVAWLFSRLIQIGANFSSAEICFRHLDTGDEAVAWFLEAWWQNYGLAGMRPVPAAPPRGAEGLVAAVRAARLGHYRLPVPAADVASLPSLFVELGEVCSTHCRLELGVELEFARARHALACGKAAAAAAGLRALLPVANSTSPLAEAWWRPLLTYWLGVACAQMGDAQAGELLESLVGGIRHHEALGQLALLDLQKGDVATAARRLESASLQVASVRYAKAVLCSRTGRPEEACELLESAEGMSVLQEPPYAVAALRLRAAIKERSGDTAASAALLQEIHRTNPGDEITILRGERQDLEAAYAAYRAGGTPAAGAWTGHLAESQPQSPPEAAQKEILTFLRSALSASPEALPALRPPEGDFTADHRAWWSQFMGASLLKSGDPRRASQALDVEAPTPVPAAVERSRTILTIWRELAGVGHGERAEAAVRLEVLAQKLEPLGPVDAEADRWRQLAQIGSAVCKGEFVADETWRGVGDPLMARIPFLFHDDAKVRSEAATGLLPALAVRPSQWDESTQLLLSALAAWALGRDETFLEHYTTLEPELDALPVAGRDLWMVGAQVRHARKDWRGVLENLPECVADMSDPLVKLVVELASVRLTADEALKGDHRDQVLRRLKGTRNNLRDLLETAPPPPQGQG